MTTLLQSFIGAAGSARSRPRRCAAPSNGQTVAHTHAEALDFAEAVDYARRVGLPACWRWTSSIAPRA
jgi:oxepin-CoA hydrolase/3-oxo-5,6-dehydrosuberyl-CoA semialdehyde dehydrogenase